MTINTDDWDEGMLLLRKERRKERVYTDDFAECHTVPKKKIKKGLRISGYASFFNTYDSEGDEVRPKAFVKSLTEFHPVMLWDHNYSSVVGRWDTIHEDRQGLWVEGIVLDRKVIKKVLDLNIRGLSIGYKPVRITHTPAGGSVLHKVELSEISLVAVPMHRRCQFRVT